MKDLNNQEMNHIIGGVFSGTYTNGGLEEIKDNINTEDRCSCTYLDVNSITNSNQATKCKCLCTSSENL